MLLSGSTTLNMLQTYFLFLVIENVLEDRLLDPCFVGISPPGGTSGLL